MGLYRYRCPDCGETEIWHDISRVGEMFNCQCGRPMKKLISKETINRYVEYGPQGTDIHPKCAVKDSIKSRVKNRKKHV